MKRLLPALFTLSLLVDTRWPAQAADAGAATLAAPFSARREFRLGGPGGWDYLTADPAGGRLFIARSDHVTVVRTSDGSIVGTVPDTAGVHGVALAPELGLGFTSNGRADTVTAFDLATLATRSVIPAGGKNPDAILFEPASRRLLTFNGRSQDISVIDPVQAKVLAIVPAGGKPEFAATDGKGRVFVNIEDTAELLVLDAQTAQIRNRWKLTGCSEPTGLAIDAEHGRLFSVCGNGVMVVTDAASGRRVAQVPIGEGADAAAYDPVRALAFSSNGQSGTLTVVHEDDPEHFRVVSDLATRRSARTMALDAQTHRVYLVAAEFGPAPAPTESQPRPRPPVLDGSFTVLELAP